MISHLQLTNNLLNSLVYLDTSSKQIAERENTIRDSTNQFEAMEEEAKMIVDEMTQFWKSVIQDDQLEKLSKQVQEAKAQLTTVKTSLHTIPLMVCITLF